MDYLNQYPDYMVFDLGAQVGQYSLFAVSFGRDVVCVEPFHDSVLRIHKAANLAKVTNRITPIKNVLLEWCTQIFNKTNDEQRIQLTNLNNRNTSQYIANNDSVLISTPKGQNTAQLIGKDGKALASFTLEVQLIWYYNNKDYDKTVLVIVQNTIG
jgi:predicted RNA-binding protein Jag